MSHMFSKSLALFVFAWIAIANSAFAAEPPVQFNRDIRPIFSDTCFHCHGPDKNARKAGLRMDLREEALKPVESGEIPIVQKILPKAFNGRHADFTQERGNFRELHQIS